MRFLNILVFLILSIIANSSMVLANATYKQLLISGYYDTGFYRSIDIALYDVKLTAQSKPIAVQFELHTSKNYQYKIYIEMSGKTFQGKIPRSLTWKQRGDYYIHGNGGDPVSVRQFYNSLDKTDGLVLRGICQFVYDRDNLENIFERVINGSNGEQKKYWQKFRTRMIGDTQVAARRCLSQFSGAKVVFKKTDKSNPNKRISGSNKTLCDLKSSGIIFDSASFKSIQKDLKVLGFYKSKIDGQFGKGSCKALKEYLSEDNITGKAIKFTKKDRFELQKDARLARYAANKLKEEAPLSKALVKKPEVPKEPQTFSLNVGSLSVEYIEDQTKDLNEYKVRLKTMGSEIDTSVVSKSLFGFENVSSVDVILNMSDTNAYVDFVIDEENTKVKFDGSKAFVMRLKDDSTSNVTSGEFGKALGGLDIRDVAMVGAHCSKDSRDNKKQ